MKGKKWENYLCIHWWKKLNPNYSTSRDKEMKGSSKSPETISLNNGSSTDSVCLHSLDIQFRPLMNRWTVRKCRKRVPLGETSARPASPDIRGMLSVISSLRTESWHCGVARRGHRRVQEWPRRGGALDNSIWVPAPKHGAQDMMCRCLDKYDFLPSGVLGSRRQQQHSAQSALRF